MKDFVKLFGDLVNREKRFLILSHVRPDGDAVGSQLALAIALSTMGKNVLCWNEDGVPERYAWLPHSDWVLTGKPPSWEGRVRVVVDTATPQRVGGLSLELQSGSPVVNIDHHASNPKYGDLHYVEPYRASCGELIFDLIRALNWKLNAQIAQCLFVAISTDTGSFQYPSANASTFRMAADLMDAGVDLGETTKLIYENYPSRRLLLLKEVLQSVCFDAQDQIGYFWIDETSFQISGARPEDAEGLIDHIRAVKSVKVAVLFEKIQNQPVVRISLRSKDLRVDVNRIAQKFGGGGHSAAAGARIEGERDEVQKRVLAAIRERLSLV